MFDVMRSPSVHSYTPHYHRNYQSDPLRVGGYGGDSVSSFDYSVPMIDMDVRSQSSIAITQPQRVNSARYQRLFNSASPYTAKKKKSRYYNRGLPSQREKSKVHQRIVARARSRRQMKEQQAKDQQMHSMDLPDLPSPRQGGHHREPSPTGSIFSATTTDSQYMSRSEVGSEYSALSGSVPRHLKARRWHKKKTKQEETFLFRWDLSPSQLNRLQTKGQIRSMELTVNDTVFRFVFSMGVDEGETFFSFQINFDQRSYLDKIIDITVHTMSGDGEELLGPVTHTNKPKNKSQSLSNMKKQAHGAAVLDGFVINRHNSRFYEFESSLLSVGISFNVEFFLESERRRIKKRKPILPTILLDPEFADFTIRCEDQSWQAHRCVLAAQSRYFKSQFAQDFNGDFKELEVTTASPQSVGVILGWMYCADVDSSRLRQAIPLAQEWEIPNLLEDIFLSENNITNSNDLVAEAVYNTYSNASMRKQSENIVEAARLLKSLEKRNGLSEKGKETLSQINMPKLLQIVDPRDLRST